MARFLMHWGSYGDKAVADKECNKAAKSLTSKGMGSTHYAKVEKKAGIWQVNVYRR